MNLLGTLDDESQALLATQLPSASCLSFYSDNGNICSDSSDDEMPSGRPGENKIVGAPNQSNAISCSSISFVSRPNPKCGEPSASSVSFDPFSPFSPFAPLSPAPGVDSNRPDNKCDASPSNNPPKSFNTFNSLNSLNSLSSLNSSDSDPSGACTNACNKSNDTDQTVQKDDCNNESKESKESKESNECIESSACNGHNQNESVSNVSNVSNVCDSVPAPPAPAASEANVANLAGTESNANVVESVEQDETAQMMDMLKGFDSNKLEKLLLELTSRHKNGAAAHSAHAAHSPVSPVTPITAAVAGVAGVAGVVGATGIAAQNGTESKRLEYVDTGKNSFDVTFMVSMPLLVDKFSQAPVPVLAVHEEEDALKRALQTSQCRILKFQRVQATVPLLRTTLTLGTRILHFCGHGVPKSLVFEKDGQLGVSQRVAASNLEKITSVGGNHGLHLVFLSACHSEEAAKAFCNAGARHVVAIKRDEQLHDAVARTFTEQFYTSLIAGRTVRDAFDIATRTLDVQYADDSWLRYEHSKFILLPRDASWPSAPSGRSSLHDVVMFPQACNNSNNCNNCNNSSNSNNSIGLNNCNILNNNWNNLGVGANAAAAVSAANGVNNFVGSAVHCGRVGPVLRVGEMSRGSNSEEDSKYSIESVSVGAGPCGRNDPRHHAWGYDEMGAKMGGFVDYTRYLGCKRFYAPKVFLGRERLLLVHNLMDLVCCNKLVLLRGAAGSGKTAVVQKMCQYLWERNKMDIFVFDINKLFADAPKRSLASLIVTCLLDTTSETDRQYVMGKLGITDSDDGVMDTLGRSAKDTQREAKRSSKSSRKSGKRGGNERRGGDESKRLKRMKMGWLVRKLVQWDKKIVMVFENIDTFSFTSLRRDQRIDSLLSKIVANCEHVHVVVTMGSSENRVDFLHQMAQSSGTQLYPMTVPPLMEKESRDLIKEKIGNNGKGVFTKAQKDKIDVDKVVKQCKGLPGLIRFAVQQYSQNRWHLSQAEIIDQIDDKITNELKRIESRKYFKVLKIMDTTMGELSKNFESNENREIWSKLFGLKRRGDTLKMVDEMFEIYHRRIGKSSQYRVIEEFEKEFISHELIAEVCKKMDIKYRPYDKRSDGNSRDASVMRSEATCASHGVISGIGAKNGVKRADTKANIDNKAASGIKSLFARKWNSLTKRGTSATNLALQGKNVKQSGGAPLAKGVGSKQADAKQRRVRFAQGADNPQAQDLHSKREISLRKKETESDPNCKVPIGAFEAILEFWGKLLDVITNRKIKKYYLYGSGCYNIRQFNKQKKLKEQAARQAAQAQKGEDGEEGSAGENEIKKDLAMQHRRIIMGLITKQRCCEIFEKYGQKGVGIIRFSRSKPGALAIGVSRGPQEKPVWHLIDTVLDKNDELWFCYPSGRGRRLERVHNLFHLVKRVESIRYLYTHLNGCVNDEELVERKTVLDWLAEGEGR